MPQPRPEWRDPAKERYWRRFLEQWRRSGLTGRDFCAQHHVSEHSFYGWKREIARRDHERCGNPVSGTLAVARQHSYCPAAVLHSKTRADPVHSLWQPAMNICQPAGLLPVEFQVVAQADGRKLKSDRLPPKTVLRVALLEDQATAPVREIQALAEIRIANSHRPIAASVPCIHDPGRNGDTVRSGCECTVCLLPSTHCLPWPASCRKRALTRCERVLSARQRRLRCAVRSMRWPPPQTAQPGKSGDCP